MDPIECPNAGPDDVDIEDLAVEDVVLEGIVVEEDPMEDPDKIRLRTTDELMTMVRSTTRGRIGRSLPEVRSSCKDSSPFNAAYS